MKKILTLLAGVAFGAAVLFFFLTPAPAAGTDPIVISRSAAGAD